jgi:hypothetical protein
MSKSAKVSPTQLKKMNTFMSIICIALFLITLLIVFGTKFENASPGNRELDFWIEGLGNIVLFSIHLVINSIICLICLLILLFTAITKKSLKNRHTIVNLILLLLFHFLPFMVLLRY